ncbi:hypothetical protein C7S18_04070 [Ahniella affigens]|uniref:Vacuolar membrane protease n=1 Tax=Ahniella affigens TaxID=2021234 RepID=A0A2P1PNJ9_9GAMM|nr:M28 family peptidase [Ahniella affigens]AVP96420.1 hypothetical protein C7S18_04070 [Ahniella affigens]
MNRSSETEAPQRGVTLGALISALICAVALWLLIAAQSPPKPVPADADQSGFSALRAADALGRVLDLQTPHPLGSVENNRVRARIMTELTRLELNPEIRGRFVCASYGVCGTPYNLLARIPGKDHSKLVVLAAHYDSVFAGPGAGDAGASVGAILEIARALKAGPPLAHDVLVLIDDGEEAGLLGARAFMQDPEAKQVRAFINMEARGTNGLSRLFETSDGNATFARLFAQHLPHPSTSSLYYEIYKLLPNDTDLSVFKAEGGTGVGMAFIGGPLRYHTPVDDLEHLDLRTLQDQGDSALALARAFVAEPGPLKAKTDAVYFDVFGRFIVYWPMALSLPIALLTLVLAGIAYARLGAHRPRLIAVLGGLLLGVLLLAVQGVGAWLVLETLKLLGLVETRWQVNLFWPSLAFMLLTVVFLPADRSRVFKTFGVDPAQPWNALFGWMLLLWLLSLLLWQVLPGAMYLTLIPVLLATLALIIRPGSKHWAGSMLCLGALITIGPMLASLYESLGSGILFALTPLSAMVLLPVAYAASKLFNSRTKFLALLICALGFGSMFVIPRFTLHEPMPLAITLVQGPETSRLSVSSEVRLESPLFKTATGLELRPELSLPWNTRPNLVGPVLNEADKVALPTLRLLGREPDGNDVIWTFDLRSARSAAVIGFVHPARWGRSAVKFNGIGTSQGAKYDRDALSGGYLSWAVYASEASFTIRLPAGDVPSGFVYDRSPELPVAFAHLNTSRINAQAMPVHTGDGVLAWLPLPSEWPEENRPGAIAADSSAAPEAAP